MTTEQLNHAVALIGTLDLDPAGKQELIDIFVSLNDDTELSELLQLLQKHRDSDAAAERQFVAGVRAVAATYKKAMGEHDKSLSVTLDDIAHQVADAEERGKISKAITKM